MSNLNCNPTAADTMSRRLTFHEIKRMAQGAEQFRKRDLIGLPRGERRGFHGRDSGEATAGRSAGSHLQSRTRPRED